MQWSFKQINMWALSKSLLTWNLMTHGTWSIWQDITNTPIHHMKIPNLTNACPRLWVTRGSNALANWISLHLTLGTSFSYHFIYFKLYSVDSILVSGSKLHWVQASKFHANFQLHGFHWFSVLIQQLTSTRWMFLTGIVSYLSESMIVIDLA